MCDYSLAALPNRLAVEGDELIVHRFRTSSMGLASAAEAQALARSKPAGQKSFWRWLKSTFENAPDHPLTAVCVPPGAQLLFKNVPQDLQRQWRITSDAGAAFVQVSAAENTYRDAVQFCNKRVVMLQNLREGMPVKVLSLGGLEVIEEQTLVAGKKGLV